MDIVSYITKLQTNVFQIRNDDDFADRLNYRYTVAILVAFAIIVSNRQFSESVIKCWVPAYFTSNFEAYANQVCWVSNTFYVNHSQQLPSSDHVRKSSEIKYYQWIPFILLIQALFLYFPRIIWRLLSTRAGIEMRDLVEAAHSYKSVEKFDNKDKMMDYITENIDQYVSNPRRLKQKDSPKQKIQFYINSFFCGSGIYLGNYLVTTYFFTKIMYIANSIGQFFLMNEFLGKQFHELGFDIIQYITTGQSIHSMIESVYFPKVVMCDFRIREFGHPNFSHKYTIQCVLPINLYNQQIFTFLWFWFLILFLANFYALCLWAYRLFPHKRRMYIKKRLNLFKDYRRLKNSSSPKVKTELSERTKNFINFYLKLDGVFIIKMISILASDIVGTEVLYELWKRRQDTDFIMSEGEDDGEDDNNLDEADSKKTFHPPKRNEKLRSASVSGSGSTTASPINTGNQITLRTVPYSTLPRLNENILKDSTLRYYQKPLPRHLSLIEEASSIENEALAERRPSAINHFLKMIKPPREQIPQSISNSSDSTNAYNHQSHYPYIDSNNSNTSNDK